MGLSFARLPILEKLFGFELQRIEKQIPFTGRTIDAKRFVADTSVLTLFCILAVSVLLPVITVAFPGVSFLLMLLLPAPLLIPLIAPMYLGSIISSRSANASSEFLAFLTYAGIMHTVHKTMFWTIQSISTFTMFSQLRLDSQIVMRYAKSGGREEGTAITMMAKKHPDRKLREFLEKYVSYIPTNPMRLGNFVETTREESLQKTVQAVKSYADSANTIFFMGTMMISIFPIMMTVMAFLPNSGIDSSFLINIMFVLPLLFVLLPAFLSTGTIFLHAGKQFSLVSLPAAAALFTVLFVLFPEYWLISASASAAVFSGLNWSRHAKKDRDANTTDEQLPDMLDYIAEQKKSKNNLMHIFSEFAVLPNTGTMLRKIMQGIASDMMIKPAQRAFLERAFPTHTTRFVFFMLHAIYEHGGGSYETIVSMAHSIRRVVEMRDSFVSSSRMSVMIVVCAPAVFMFCVMMTSFMTFGVPDSAADGQEDFTAGGMVMAIKSSDIESVVQSLQPVALIIAIAGGFGISRVVCYSFLNTKYLFFTTVVSTVCLALWDALFGIMRGMSV